MKGRIIAPSLQDRIEGDYGIGLECPNCEKDMRKVTKIKVKARFSQEKGKMETKSEPSVSLFVCDACGYTEQLKVD